MLAAFSVTVVNPLGKLFEPPTCSVVLAANEKVPPAGLLSAVNVDKFNVVVDVVVTDKLPATVILLASVFVPEVDMVRLP